MDLKRFRVIKQTTVWLEPEGISLFPGAEFEIDLDVPENKRWAENLAADGIIGAPKGKGKAKAKDGTKKKANKRKAKPKTDKTVIKAKPGPGTSTPEPKPEGLDLVNRVDADELPADETDDE